VLHPDVGDINTLGLVNLLNTLVSQKIGVDLASRMEFAQIRLRVDNLNAHQSLDSLSVDEIALSLQDILYSPRAIKGSLGILFID